MGSQADDVRDRPAPAEVGGYRLDGIVGTGRMGTVYLAHHPDLPRDDALKVLNRDLLDDPSFHDRFTREADTIAGLTHPNIVGIYRRGSTDSGVPWIAMQYVPGTDADTALRDGTMTPARAVRVVSEIAKALDFAHRRGVVHRDVKPSNFFLSTADAHDDEHVLLGDFGIAQSAGVDQLHHRGPVLATAAYAAPEVLRGSPTDGRSDLYSLGCSLFRLLTGSTPYPAADTAETIHHHLHSPPPNVTDLAPRLPPDFNVVIAKAMAKDPGARYQTGKELAAAASAALYRSPERLPKPIDTTQPRVEDAPLPAPARRYRPSPKQLRIGGVALAALAALAGILWLSTSHTDDPPSADRPAPTTTAPGQRDPAAQAAIQRLLPAGYSRDSCIPDDPSLGALATLRCGPNNDRGGPTTAQYFLMPDTTTLGQALTTVVGESTTILCPGNVMSPGAWHHNVNPEVPAGTLFCGTQSGRPVIAWTSDDQRMLHIASGSAGGATLDELYTWWSSHS
ncbi:MAG: eukaryotic-like serine/threonine-protein kinase [Actinomycetota bacterium]|nr:eukaryotic-like serine/threonine-protein kinase [Actinomycetota bacterium]